VYFFSLPSPSFSLSLFYALRSTDRCNRIPVSHPLRRHGGR
jgi:hypothetical protein